MPTATVAVVAVPAELNIDALGHLQVLGVGRSDAHKQWGSHQHRRGCCHGESNLDHLGVPPWAWPEHVRFHRCGAKARKRWEVKRTSHKLIGREVRRD